MHCLGYVFLGDSIVHPIVYPTVILPGHGPGMSAYFSAYDCYLFEVTVTCDAYPNAVD